jgi:signal transduction histidine kinase
MLDEELLKTAFLNIIINAIEAMEAQTGILKVLTYIKADKIVVWIEDNGPGISREEQRKLFDPFFTGKKEGMGLGLTSAQNIIHSHNGSIEVDSEPGNGTIFKISFKREVV